MRFAAASGKLFLDVFPCFFVVNLFAFIVVVVHLTSSPSFLHLNVHCLEGALGFGFLIICFQ